MSRKRLLLAVLGLILIASSVGIVAGSWIQFLSKNNTNVSPTTTPTETPAATPTLAPTTTLTPTPAPTETSSVTSTPISTQSPSETFSPTATPTIQVNPDNSVTFTLPYGANVSYRLPWNSNLTILNYAVNMNLSGFTLIITDTKSGLSDIIPQYQGVHATRIGLQVTVLKVYMGGIVILVKQ